LVFLKNFKHPVTAKEHGTKKYKGAPKYIIVQPEECNIAHAPPTPLKKKELFTVDKNTGCL